MKRWAGWLAVAAACRICRVDDRRAGAIRRVDPPTYVLGADGETAPVYSFANAIRERVWVPVPGVDQNADGVDDRVALDIIRPQETQTQGMKVPAIIDVSPYYTSLGRGNETEFIQSRVDDAGGQAPPLLRQLLRSPRLRVHRRAGRRHRVVDRLPAARRTRRRRRLQGR